MNEKPDLTIRAADGFSDRLHAAFVRSMPTRTLLVCYTDGLQHRYKGRINALIVDGTVLEIQEYDEKLDLKDSTYVPIHALRLWKYLT